MADHRETQADTTPHLLLAAIAALLTGGFFNKGNTAGAWLCLFLCAYQLAHAAHGFCREESTDNPENEVDAPSNEIDAPGNG